MNCWGYHQGSWQPIHSRKTVSEILRAKLARIEKQNVTQVVVRRWRAGCEGQGGAGGRGRGGQASNVSGANSGAMSAHVEAAHRRIPDASVLQDIRATFKFFDDDGSGSVSVDELGRAFQRLGLKLPQVPGLPSLRSVSSTSRLLSFRYLSTKT